jgi:hypothetical protein
MSCGLAFAAGQLAVMCDKSANKTPPHRVQHIALPALDRCNWFDEPDLYTFECRACGVWHIEEATTQ